MALRTAREKPLSPPATAWGPGREQRSRSRDHPPNPPASTCLWCSTSRPSWATCDLPKQSLLTGHDGWTAVPRALWGSCLPHGDGHWCPPGASRELWLLKTSRQLPQPRPEIQPLAAACVSQPVHLPVPQPAALWGLPWHLRRNVAWPPAAGGGAGAGPSGGSGSGGGGVAALPGVEATRLAQGREGSWEIPGRPLGHVRVFQQELVSGPSSAPPTPRLGFPFGEMGTILGHLHQDHLVPQGWPPQRHCPHT